MNAGERRAEVDRRPRACGCARSCAWRDRCVIVMMMMVVIMRRDRWSCAWPCRCCLRIAAASSALSDRSPFRIRIRCTSVDLQLLDAQFVARRHLHMPPAAFGAGAEALFERHGLRAIEAPTFARRRARCPASRLPRPCRARPRRSRSASPPARHAPSAPISSRTTRTCAKPCLRASSLDDLDDALGQRHFMHRPPPDLDVESDAGIEHGGETRHAARRRRAGPDLDAAQRGGEGAFGRNTNIIYSLLLFVAGLVL